MKRRDIILSIQMFLSFDLYIYMNINININIYIYIFTQILKQ